MPTIQDRAEFAPGETTGGVGSIYNIPSLLDVLAGPFFALDCVERAFDEGTLFITIPGTNTGSIHHRRTRSQPRQDKTPKPVTNVQHSRPSQPTFDRGLARDQHHNSGHET